MSYVVTTKKGYRELRESYRDPATGKPRSRFLRYLGKLGDIDWKATLQGDPEDRAMAVAERLGAEADARRAPVVEEPSRLLTGLHVGPVDPVQTAPVEQVQETAPAEHAGPAPDDATPSETGHELGAAQGSDGASGA
jgi:hypothetical protein